MTEPFGQHLLIEGQRIEKMYLKRFGTPRLRLSVLGMVVSPSAPLVQ
jgi:hypothetical protein